MTTYRLIDRATGDLLFTYEHHQLGEDGPLTITDEEILTRVGPLLPEGVLVDITTQDDGDAE